MMSTTIEKVTSWNGYFPKLPEAEYYKRTLGVANKSGLDEIAVSPAHYYSWCEEPGEAEETPALAFGHAFHCAVLEPEKFRETYLVEPDFGRLMKHDASGTTKEQGAANKARRAKWRDDNGWLGEEPPVGVRLISQKAMTKIERMAGQMQCHRLIRQILEKGDREVTIRWTDAITGLPCKGRVDFFDKSTGIALDLKTTEDARTTNFAKAVTNYGYHRQQAFYEDGFAAVGMPLRAFLFPISEKSAPHACSLKGITPESVEAGRKSIRRDLLTLATCVETGSYPGYSEDVEMVPARPWADGFQL